MRRRSARQATIAAVTTTSATDHAPAAGASGADGPSGPLAPAAPPGPRRARPTDLVALLACGALLPAVLATFAASHWSCDLMAHFPLHCLLALAPAAAVLALARRWRWTLLCAFGVALCGQRLAPQLVGDRPALAIAALTSGTDTATSAAPGAAAPTLLELTVATANLRAGNQRTDELVAWVDAVAPDVLALSELTPQHWARLQPLRARFPFVQAEPRAGCFGIALLSRLPFAAVRTAPLGHDWAPAIAAQVRSDAGPVGIVAAHPPPPGAARRSGERDRSLRALPPLLADLPARRIVLGDLNATPWSAPFEELLATAGLSDSTRGAGLQGSWPSSLPALLRIPIDHVLVSRGIGVAARELGPDIGSDHLPVAARLLLSAARSW